MDNLIVDERHQVINRQTHFFGRPLGGVLLPGKNISPKIKPRCHRQNAGMEKGFCGMKCVGHGFDALSKGSER